MIQNRSVIALVLMLVLLGQGVVLAGAGRHGMCHMSATAAAGMAADCDQLSDHGQGMCAQCVQCAGGHCAVWAIPAGVDSNPSHRAALPDPVSLEQRTPQRPPARLYRPPRLSA